MLYQSTSITYLSPIEVEEKLAQRPLTRHTFVVWRIVWQPLTIVCSHPLTFVWRPLTIVCFQKKNSLSVRLRAIHFCMADCMAAAYDCMLSSAYVCMASAYDCMLSEEKKLAQRPLTRHTFLYGGLYDSHLRLYALRNFEKSFLKKCTK